MAVAVGVNSPEVFIRELEIDTLAKVLKIYQYAVGDVGFVVWDAGIALAKYLDFSQGGSGFYLENKTVIELGSGTGVVGLFAAALGANVTLTDLPELIPLLEKNIEVNKCVLKGLAKAIALKWGEQHSVCPVDIILVADCVYYKKSLDQLVSTIFDLSGPNTQVLLSYEERDDKKELMNVFLSALKEQFVIDSIPYHEQHPRFQSPDIRMLKLHNA